MASLRQRSPNGRRRSRSSARTSTGGSPSSSSLDDDAPVNFIVHRGDTKDPADSPDRSFDPAATPEIWLRDGDLTIYSSQAEAQGYATVHYACTDCSAVTIDVTGASGPVLTGAPPDTTDDYGAVFRVTPPAPTLRRR